MKKQKYKVATDILSMLLVVALIVTGLMLHRDVWHVHVYDNRALWGWHEGIGLALMCMIGLHCVQHSFWFKNYVKIHVDRKRVTTLLLFFCVVVGVTGVILMCGSRSELVSHIHYACAIVFTVMAIGHVIKRWKIFRSIL